MCSGPVGLGAIRTLIGRALELDIGESMVSAGEVRPDAKRGTNG
jgi:hypothetical protein